MTPTDILYVTTATRNAAHYAADAAWTARSALYSRASNDVLRALHAARYAILHADALAKEALGEKK
jgi:hypothetical protein